MLPRRLGKQDALSARNAAENSNNLPPVVKQHASLKNREAWHPVSTRSLHRQGLNDRVGANEAPTLQNCKHR